MKRFLLVMRHEWLVAVTRKSFLFSAIGLPIISGLLFVIFGMVKGKMSDGIPALPGLAPAEISSVQAATDLPRTPYGLVDPGGIVQSFPPSLEPKMIKIFPNEAAAMNALKTGQIEAYYVIPENYLQTGELQFFSLEVNWLNINQETQLMDWVILGNLLSGDWKLAERIANPSSLEIIQLDSSAPRPTFGLMTIIAPYSVTLIYINLLMMSSSLLLHSVTKEKENRQIEVLISTISTRQLLCGKLAGLGLAALLQAILWLGTGYSISQLAGQIYPLPSEMQLGPSVLVWGLIFYLLGYGVYAGLMVGLGALVPNLREASQLTLVVLSPLLIPLVLFNLLVQEPTNVLTILLSLFPLTSPVSMMTRLAAGVVPAWQLILSAAFLGLTVALVLQFAARLFRAQTLLSGQPFSIKRFLLILANSQ